ncbi:Mss4p nuclear export [Neocucurbitaria cava]|uniref:Protein BCP1 n=1 Tax=Neocucurbitaria cava TaxID=798079 RepID=A0A9W8Y627_9PLEO|nr:Mss4p nuclear export [Neocucurbitaria cava]
MAKRKPERDPEDLPDASDKNKQKDDDESGSDEDMDMVNVDFEWFDPQPAFDFHGLKTLLRQLLDVDNQLFDLSALADLILSQPLLGSTVKVDGNETDPYAFLTVLNLETHKDKKVIQDLTRYLTKKSSSSSTLPALAPLLESSSPAQIGLILTERFINMPHEIVPPMYTMLLEEIQWALQEKEPYAFTHYLVLSKCYSEVQSSLPSSDARPPSSKKSKKGGGREETFYFHPEDEVLQKHAVEWGSFEYDTPVDEGASDSKRAFQELGVKPKGHLVLIEAGKFEGAVEGVRTFLNGDGQ